MMVLRGRKKEKKKYLNLHTDGAKRENDQGVKGVNMRKDELEKVKREALRLEEEKDKRNLEVAFGKKNWFLWSHDVWSDYG